MYNNTEWGAAHQNLNDTAGTVLKVHSLTVFLWTNNKERKWLHSGCKEPQQNKPKKEGISKYKGRKCWLWNKIQAQVSQSFFGGKKIQTSS